MPRQRLSLCTAARLFGLCSREALAQATECPNLRSVRCRVRGANPGSGRALYQQAGCRPGPPTSARSVRHMALIRDRPYQRCHGRMLYEHTEQLPALRCKLTNLVTFQKRRPADFFAQADALDRGLTATRPA